MNSKNKKLLKKINKENRKHTRNSALARHKKKKIKEWVILLSIVIIIASFTIFMFSPYVKLKNITVAGEKQLTKEEILSAGAINNNLKTWTIKDGEVEKKIKDNFNIVKNVKVTSKMLNSINIEIEEYKIIAKNKKEDGSYEVILENGDVYNKEIKNFYHLPLVEGFEEDKDKRADIYRNLTALKEEVSRQVSEIINDKDSKETATIYMRDGQKVKVLSANFSEKLNYYNEIAQYIKEKEGTTLNLINGAYLETKKSNSEKESKIQELLGNPLSQNNNKENVDHKESVDNKNSTNSTNTNTNTKTKEQQSVDKQPTANTPKKKYTP